MPHLLILEGPDVDRRIDLDGRLPLVIGRSPRCSIVLRDREVSRRHAEFFALDGTFCIRDLGSSNGTNVNGEPITSHTLGDRDRVQVGRNLMVFFDSEPADSFQSNPSLNSVKSESDVFDIEIVQAGVGEGEFDEGLSQIRHSIGLKSTSSIAAGMNDSVYYGAIAESRVQESVDPANYLKYTDPNGEYWQMMYRAVIQISRTSDLQELVQQILAMIFQWIQCDRACILFADPVTKTLKPVGRLDRNSQAGSSAIRISQTILDYVTRTGEAVLTGDAISDERWNVSASIAQAGIREAICVPMPGRHGLVGVIYIDTSAALGRMSAEEKVELLNIEQLKLLSAIGHHAALVVEDAYIYQTMLRSERLAAMGTVISSISHHIKNILQGIEGGSFLVNSALQNGDMTAVAQGWKVVEKNQRRIKSLVLDMLAYGKERQPQMAEHDMNAIVQDAIDLLASAAQDQHVQLTFELKPALAKIYGDADSIYHAVVNLITNAVEACVDRRKSDTQFDYQPKVTVEIKTNRGHIETVVMDNGSGMTESQIERVFVAFESTKGGKGSGLGLAVSRKIINEHGGNILVASEIGKGTTFTIQLPADVDPEQSRHVNQQTISF